MDILFEEEEYKGQKEELKERLNQRLEGVKDENLRHVLQQLLRDTDFQLSAFRARVEEWYDEVMERVGGWYKRNIQAILILLGLFIAVAFDADTVNIFHELSRDATTRQELVQLVDTYAKNINQSTTSNFASSGFKTQIDAIIQEEIDAINQRSEERLGLGWYEDTMPKDGWEWFYKILGWMVTALAISLGAPFWFGLLKKIMNLRNSGGLPQVVTAPVQNNEQPNGANQSHKDSFPERIIKPADEGPVG